MDGNGRWAKNNNLDISEGHKKGAESAWEIVKYCSENNINNLSLFAFSSENWKRPKIEVANILNLLDRYIDEEFNKFNEYNIRFKFLGDLSKLPADLQLKIYNLISITKLNKGMTLNVAFSYGGRQEIISAVKKSIESVNNSSDINEDNFKQYMYIPDLPDVDFLIRTGGEKRISNFLLWHIAYAELYFEEKLWPDFSIIDLHDAILNFLSRKRNYGKRELCI